MFLRQAPRGLVGSNQYSEAAKQYTKLGQTFFTMAEKGGGPLAQRYYREAVINYEEAFKLYKAAGETLNSAEVASAIVSVAQKARLYTYAFIYSDLAVDAYLELARTAGKGEEKFLYFNKAGELLRTQVGLVHSYRELDAHASYELALRILENRAVALQGAVINNPLLTFGADATRGREAYYAAQAELADVYRSMGDAHIELKQFDKAATAYEQGEQHSMQVAPDMRATRSSSEREIREACKLHVMVLVAKLERDGDGERTAEVVRKLEELHHSGKMFLTRLLDDPHSWLSEALGKVLTKDAHTTFKARVRDVLKVRIK